MFEQYAEEFINDLEFDLDDTDHSLIDEFLKEEED